MLNPFGCQDPLMDTLMEDPVKLPCKHTARRSILVVCYALAPAYSHAWMHGCNEQVGLSLTV